MKKFGLFEPVASKNVKKLPTSSFNSYLRERPKNDSPYIKTCKIL